MFTFSFAELQLSLRTANVGDYLNQKEQMSHCVCDILRLGGGTWQDMNFKVLTVVIIEPRMLFMALDHN